MLSSGLLLGLVLDLYQLVKERLCLTDWVTSLVDLFYWLGSAFLIFALLFWSNWGELRFYIFIAIIVGFLLYYRYFRLWLNRPLCLLIRLIEILITGFMQLCYYLFWVPLIFLVQMLKRIFGVASMPLRWMFRPIMTRFQTWLNKLRSNPNKEK